MYAVPIGGTDPVSVLEGGPVSSDIALAPDGTRIAFVRADADHPPEIFVAPIERGAGQPEQVTHLHDRIAGRI